MALWGRCAARPQRLAARGWRQRPGPPPVGGAGRSGAAARRCARSPPAPPHNKLFSRLCRGPRSDREQEAEAEAERILERSLCFPPRIQKLWSISKALWMEMWTVSRGDIYYIIFGCWALQWFFILFQSGKLAKRFILLIINHGNVIFSTFWNWILPSVLLLR